MNQDGSAKAPVFVGGLSRSGIALLSGMLGRHPAIALAPRTDWSAGDGAPLAAQPPLAAGKQRWLEPSPGNVTAVDRIFARWPEARFVHVVRDPRDLFVGQREAKEAATLEEFGAAWIAAFATLDGFRAAGVATPGNTLEIRYEALVARPEVVLRPLLTFLGEEWDPAVLLHPEPVVSSRIGIRGALSSIEADDLRAYISARAPTTPYMKILGETLAIDQWAQKLR